MPRTDSHERRRCTHRRNILSIVVLYFILFAFPIDSGHGQQNPSYVVNGLRLGEIVTTKPIYQEMSCIPSNAFAGNFWCSSNNRRIVRGYTERRSISVLHSSTGETIYSNLYITPALFGRNDLDVEISRLSRIHRENPTIVRSPASLDSRNGIIAIWGDVRLEPLDSEAIRQLAEGVTLNRGLLVDFFGDLRRSARAGLPVYLITGNAGLIWNASYDREGRGHLRLAAADMSRAERQIDNSTPQFRGLPDWQQYEGKWVQDLSLCTSDGDHLRFQISRNDIGMYETGCSITHRTRSSDGYVVEAACQAEDEPFTGRFLFSPAPRGRLQVTLNAWGQRNVYVVQRCPTERAQIAPAQPDSSVRQNACLAPRIAQNMKYIEARRIIINSGYQARVQNPYGYTAEDEKVTSECSGDVAFCNKYPEIISCSGSGNCAMEFQDAWGNTLSLSTYALTPSNEDEGIVMQFSLRCRRR